MNAVWATVVVVGLASVVLKGCGPVVLGSRELPAALQRVVALMAPTLLTALIVTQVFAHDQRVVIDARAAGLAAGALALLFRAPTLVVVLSAAGVCGLVRAVG